MAAKRKDMSIIKQILRLRQQGYSNGSIIRATGVAKNTVKKYLRLAEVSTHSLEELISWEDPRLEAYFSKKPEPKAEGRDRDLAGLLSHYDKELDRVGVNRWVLWGEYRQRYPQGYGYSRFCHLIHEYKQQQKASLHIEHIPGDKVFMDFAGKKLYVTDRESGEQEEVEVFVALPGYSQFTYVEAMRSQKKANLIDACVNALHFFGGAPAAVVCDNLKSAVDKPCRYEPTVNAAFEDFANHYGMAVLPTRSRKPQDKAAVEKAVSIVYSRIYAPIRDRVFFSLEELNEAIRESLDVHNATHFQNREESRKDIFDREEKSLLKPLPERYELKYYREVTALKNCHVELREDKHYYSVPHRFIGKKVKMIYTVRHIAIYCEGEQIAFHLRNMARYKYTTVKEHLPSHHQFVSDWNPEKFLSWAAGIDSSVQDYIQQILHQKQHPEQAYKSCVGILSMARRVGKKELITACKKGLELSVYSYTFIRRVIKNGCAELGSEHTAQMLLPLHDNIRGASYYK
jgi:transposase